MPGRQNASRPKCGSCGAPLLPSEPVEVSLDVLRKAARMDDLPLVVDFWAAWYAPCRTTAPEFAKAARAFQRRARFAKLDTEAFPEAGASYRIQGIPLLIGFRGGREVKRRTGVTAARDIADWVGTLATA